jgi:hypothetical protein
MVPLAVVGLVYILFTDLQLLSHFLLKTTKLTEYQRIISFIILRTREERSGGVKEALLAG